MTPAPCRLRGQPHMSFPFRTSTRCAQDIGTRLKLITLLLIIFYGIRQFQFVYSAIIVLCATSPTSLSTNSALDASLDHDVIRLNDAVALNSMLLYIVFFAPMHAIVARVKGATLHVRAVNL